MGGFVDPLRLQQVSEVEGTNDSTGLEELLLDLEPEPNDLEKPLLEDPYSFLREPLISQVRKRIQQSVPSKKNPAKIALNPLKGIPLETDNDPTDLEKRLVVLKSEQLPNLAEQGIKPYLDAIKNPQLPNLAELGILSGLPRLKSPLNVLSTMRKEGGYGNAAAAKAGQGFYEQGTKFSGPSLLELYGGKPSESIKPPAGKRQKR